MAVPRLRAPIVLVPGLFGFDRLRLGPWVLLEYFRGVPAALRAAGNRVFVATPGPTAGVAQRAGELLALLDRVSPGEPVHLIAHSLGGLDSRYLISKLGRADRVLSLTTLGTPHRGTAFADWGLRRLGPLLLPLLRFFGVPHGAFHDLTPASCARFNAEAPDAPNVRYYSVAASIPPRSFALEWHLPSRVLTHHGEGEHDGVVSVQSARWGEGCEVWGGDHFHLINWFHPVNSTRGRWPDRVADYVRLVARLADLGL
jgi:triacylglycerol lipase